MERSTRGGERRSGGSTMKSVPQKRMLIVDFGGQLTQLIARRLREAGVYCEIKPFQLVSAKFLRDEFRPAAIVLSGGPASVCDEGCPLPPQELYELGIPVLGICYGQQAMMAQLGGRVERGGKREFGRVLLASKNSAPAHRLFEGMFQHGPETVWMSHGDVVTELAPGFEAVASSENAPLAVVADFARNFVGVQFHPEAHHTPNGSALLWNFARLAGFEAEWNMGRYKDEAMARIRTQAGSGHVICAVSGGVDSTVTAALIQAAIPGRITCIFVDSGLLRKGEAASVTGLFRKHFNIPLRFVDASAEFLVRLKGVKDPEAKRKIIGGAFVDVFKHEARTITDAEFLAQGTLYPDVVESVSVSGGPSSTIKTHHNVGGLPEELGFELVEPLRFLFKDEVRALGRELGVPDQFIGRHPSPGPGLAIRCLGKVSRKKLRILRRADSIFLDQIRRHGLYDDIWQAFAVLAPVRTVGVMGDGRTYERVCVLRAVTSVDGMTADYYRFGHEFLAETANRIVNEVSGINRVAYDITSKPPGTIEWE